jgi:menaquinone-dependent protoporphyrinogen oxidase
MTVLLSVSSRHGSTAEIAARIGEILDRRAQISVAAATPTDIQSLEGFDACVIGSAVYMGRWLKEARELVHRVSGCRRSLVAAACRCRVALPVAPPVTAKWVDGIHTGMPVLG